MPDRLCIKMAHPHTPSAASSRQMTSFRLDWQLLAQQALHTAIEIYTGQLSYFLAPVGCSWHKVDGQ